MEKLSRFTPFILLIAYYFFVFKSQMNSNIKLYIAIAMVIISLLIFWFLNKQNVDKKKLTPLIVGLVFSAIISIYFITIF